MPQLDPGVVAPGLVPVVTPVGGDRLQRDPQVRSAGPGGQPPSPVSARRAELIGGGEGEPRPLPWSPPGGSRPSGEPGFRRFPWDRGSGWRSRGRWRVPARRSRLRTRSTRGLRAAARARSLASHGSIGPIPAISPGRSARSARVISGMVRVIRPANPAGIAPDSDPPGADAASLAWVVWAVPATVCGTVLPVRAAMSLTFPAVLPAMLGGIVGLAVRAGSSRARGCTQQDVQVGPGPQLIHRPRPAGLLQLPRPCADPLVRCQHLRGGQLPAHQRRVP